MLQSRGLAEIDLQNKQENNSSTFCLMRDMSNFSCVLLSAVFFKSSFSKNSFRNTIRLLNSLDPD